MDSKASGIIFMIISSLSLAMMQILVAATSRTTPLFEQMIFRNGMTAFISYLVLRKKGVRKVFGKRSNLLLLSCRSLLGFLAMVALFWASGRGNQGEVSVLSKLSPFVVTFCAFLFLREKVEVYQLLALSIAFLGAFITVNPSFGGFSNPGLVALSSSIFSGVAYFIVGKLKGREEPEVIVFFFAVTCTVLCTLLSLFDFRLPSTRDFLLLLGMAVFSAIGQLTLTYSYTCAKASEVSVFNYSGIPGAMVFGYIFLGQPVKGATLLGSLLVIGSGILSYWGDRKAMTKQDR